MAHPTDAAWVRFHLADLNATERCAVALAASLDPGAVLYLDGPFGAGKTAFVRALAYAMGLCRDEPVTSPSYALIHHYPTCPVLVHVDLYRLDDDAAVVELGLDEWHRTDAVMCIEWARRHAAELPAATLVLDFRVAQTGARHLTVQPACDAGGALLQHWRTRFEGISCAGDA
ncbi:MAG: tRNA (adenosine(37)-N6)-threonylcarbamoyltransferase complex ATPase subunit type 1 TsaE [Polyangiales bacterium]